MVNRYFTPTQYNQKSFLPFTTANDHYIDLNPEIKGLLNQYVSENNITYFNNHWFDMSQIAFNFFPQ